jgi:hypothetical protein
MRWSQSDKTDNARRALLANVILLLMTCLLLLAGLEAAFRVNAWQSYRKSFDAVVREGRQGGSKLEQGLRNNTEVGLGFIIRVSQHKEIVYELTPNMNAYFAKAKVTTNADGFRDREYLKVKPPLTVRILGIGDSLMFGNGVWQGRDYLALLEGLLNKKHPEVNWEVINTAVPGYNTVQELGMLRHYGLQFKPDIVLLGFYENDFCLPNFLISRENYFTFKKSFFLSFLTERLGILKGTFQPAHKQAEIVRQALGICDEDRAPEEYSFMVGKEAVHKALIELKNISSEQGFDPLFVMVHPNPSEASLSVSDFARGLGMRTINAGFAIENYMKANGIKRYRSSPLSVKENDPHLSKLGHRLIAEELLRDLTDSGLIKEYIEKHETAGQ